VWWWLLRTWWWTVAGRRAITGQRPTSVWRQHIAGRWRRGSTLSGYSTRGGAEGGFGPTTGADVPPDDPG